MSEIIHRLSNYDVRTIGKFEAALRKEFDLKVVFRLDHHKEHCTNDANLRDICAAFTEVKEITPTFVRQVLSEKMVYMRYPRGTANSGRVPKDMFGRPEKSQVVVVSLPKKGVGSKNPAVSLKVLSTVSELRLSPFEREHNLKEILAGLSKEVGAARGYGLGYMFGGEFVEKHLTVEITYPTGGGNLDALLKYLTEDIDSVLIVPAPLVPSITSVIHSKHLGEELFKRIITETRFVTLMGNSEVVLAAKPELAVFMQAKTILGYNLTVTRPDSRSRTNFFQKMYIRRGNAQKIVLVN